MMDELFEVLLGFITMPVFYIAGRERIIEHYQQKFCEWASDLMMNTQTKNGLSNATKQTLLDSFMKGADK